MALALIVCGSRDWTDENAVYDALFWLMGKYVDLIVIEGAATGADSIAGGWAETWAAEHVSMPAKWEEHGKAAGPIRNGEMLAELMRRSAQHYRVGVLAFPLGESRGTRHMMRIAGEAGVRVVDATVGVHPWHKKQGGS